MKLSLEISVRNKNYKEKKNNISNRKIIVREGSPKSYCLFLWLT